MPRAGRAEDACLRPAVAASVYLQLLFPLGSLDWVALLVGGDLLDRLNAFQGFERDSRLEFGAVNSSFS